jgi:hypothetical protein
MQTTYKATTLQENGKYYPAIEFISSTVSQLQIITVSQLKIINDPQQTRSKALTIARNTIKSFNQ